jgi:hypothetical protein
MADAPSVNTSTRSIADNGIELMSTLVPEKAVLARRRPLSRTRVRAEPSPRNDADAYPTPVAPSEPCRFRPPIDELELSRSTTPIAVWMPTCSISCRVIT